MTVSSSGPTAATTVASGVPAGNTRTTVPGAEPGSTAIVAGAAVPSPAIGASGGPIGVVLADAADDVASRETGSISDSTRASGTASPITYRTSRRRTSAGRPTCGAAQ